MIWIVLLIVMLLIGGLGAYFKNGESYSAGRGLYKGSEFDLDDGQKDFSDYEPWEHRDMRD